MAKPTINIDRLRDLLAYDCETGLFTWKVAAGRRVHVGDVAGWKSDRGYTVIMVDGRAYVAQRLAWFYVNGEWPKQQIDHINGDRSDNRIENLRDVSAMVNCQNRREAAKSKKSGLPLGVCRIGSSKIKPYEANIRVNGVARYLGTYSDPHQAHAVYLEAKRQMHSGCTI